MPDTGTTNQTLDTNPTLEQNTPQEPQKNAFYDSLPDHLKENKSLRKFDSIDKLADAYVNASRLIGKKVGDLKLGDLGNILDAEQVAEIYKGIGKPQSIDDYKMPDGLDEGISSKVRQTAFELEISPEKLERLLSLEGELMASQRDQAQESWRAEVFNEFGKNSETVIKNASSIVHEFGGAEFVEYLNKTGLGDHPALVRTFAKIHSLIKEDKVPVKGGVISSEADQVEKSIKEFTNDKVKYARWRNGEKDARDELNALYSKLK